MQGLVFITDVKTLERVDYYAEDVLQTLTVFHTSMG